MKQRAKQWIFRLLGKDPEAVVVTFASGPPDLCGRMAEEVRSLVPGRRHFLATEENWPQLRRELKRYRVGLAPVMLSHQAAALRRAAYRLAPRKILAYNSRLERHHLGLNLASFLFWRGVPLDRIYLRPWWWPWPKRERSVAPGEIRRHDGRAVSPARRRVAVLSPYFPYPLAHGGAVRIFHLLRELAAEYDVELFAFTDGPDAPELAPVLEFCARLVLVEKPRYREPRWSTLLPPEVHEFRSPAMRRAIAEERRAFGFERLQVEYTQLAAYGGDVLVEHDVTFDLFGQVAAPRAKPGRMVELLPLAPLRDARGRALPPRRRDVEERSGNARPHGARGRHRKRSGPGPLLSGARTAAARVSCSSVRSAISPTWRHSDSSPKRSGPSCGRNSRG